MDPEEINADSTGDDYGSDDIIDDIDDNTYSNYDRDETDDNYACLLDDGEYDYDPYVIPDKIESDEDKLMKALNSLLIEVEKMEKDPKFESFEFKPRLDKLCEGQFNIIASSIITTNLITIINVNILKCCIKFMFDKMVKDITIYELKYKFDTLCDSMRNVIDENKTLNDQVVLVNSKIVDYEVAVVEKDESEKRKEWLTNLKEKEKHVKGNNAIANAYYNVDSKLNPIRSKNINILKGDYDIITKQKRKEKREKAMREKINTGSYYHDSSSDGGSDSVSLPDEKPHWTERGDYKYNEIKTHHQRFNNNTNNNNGDVNSLSRFQNSNVVSKYINM